MAILFDFTEEQQREWTAWVESRPPEIQELCRRFPPNRLYRLKDTGHRVTLLAYAEDGTLRVNVSGQYNTVIFEREVFGIVPEDLTECELPSPDEPLGAMLTEEEDIDVIVDHLRDKC